jgi:hypothetical protein
MRPSRAQQTGRQDLSENKDVPNTDKDSASERTRNTNRGEHHNGRKSTPTASSGWVQSRQQRICFILRNPTPTTRDYKDSTVSKSHQNRRLRFTSNKNDERSKTWWQTQSEFCGVPNGISYELDKDRSSRIKALGNSIVPQIARQIGLSIMKAELN